MERGLTLDGRFRLERVVGSGGHAEVWRALDLDRQATVAVKLLSPATGSSLGGTLDGANRLDAEARMLASLQVPGIVGYVAHGVAPGGSPYLVEDWIDGPTVRARMNNLGLDAVEAVALVMRIAEIAGAAHARGVIHRDLKPENILLAGGALDDPRLIDFGLSRRSGLGGLTRTGVIVGTVGYLAPEQARGDRDLDVRVDVFALGCILYEALCGRPAFAGSGLLAVSAKVQRDEPPAIAALCPEAAAVAPVLAHMLAKDRAERFADGLAVARALGAITPGPGPRRVRGHDEVATLIGDAGSPVTAVVALGNHGPDEPEAATWSATCASWTGPGAAALIDAAALVIAFARPAADDAALAARTLAARLTDATIVIVTAPRDQILDRGFELAERAALADAFGPAGVRVDRTTAALLAAAAIRPHAGELVLADPCTSPGTWPGDPG